VPRPKTGIREPARSTSAPGNLEKNIGKSWEKRGKIHGNWRFLMVFNGFNRKILENYGKTRENGGSISGTWRFFPSISTDVTGFHIP